jgi:methanogenic corrinoid protein MtbC1
MVKQDALEKYLEALLNGDRLVCRGIIEEAMKSGVSATSIYMDIVWPIMIEIDTLFRNDKIDSAQESMATRINRTIVDQLQNKLPRKTERKKRVVVCSAASEHGELGGQMINDLFESDGWDVRFLGSSVDNDDVMSFIHSFVPDILVIYGTEAKSAPEIRSLIDKIRSVNAFPDMKIMLSGGVFARAEGLWEEIGADLYAENAAQAILNASATNETKPVRTINRRKRKTTTSSKKTKEALVS